MTVSTAIDRVQYATNGTTGPWTVPFRFLQDSHLQVVHASSAGVETILVLNTDYTVAGAGAATGTVTTTTAYTAGGTITVVRDIPLTQETDYGENDPFPANTHEMRLDWLTMAAQQLSERVDRAISIPVSDTVTNVTLPAPADRILKTWTTDSNGNLVFTTPAAGTAAALASDLIANNATNNGAGMVGFNGSLNYVAGTIGFQVLDDVHVTQFPWLADNTGAADASAAINAAIAAAKGRWRCYVPDGTYLLTSPLQVNEQTGTNVVRRANHLIGAGIEKTIFLNRSGDYAVKHTVTGAQAAAQSKAYHGEIGKFSIKHDGSSPANSAGISLEAFWNGYVHDVFVSAPLGHGLNVDVNGALGVSSDWYSSGHLQVERFTVSAATGAGIFHNNPGTILFVRSPYIVNCAGGGIQTCGARGSIVDGSVAGNGTFGIKIAYTTTTPHNILVRGIEIDNNEGKQVIIEGYHNVVTQCRFIQTEVAGAFPATHGVYIDSTASGGGKENEISYNLMDLRNRVSGTHTWVEVTNTAGSTGNKIIDTNFSATAGLTKYVMPAARARNTATENDLVVANSTSAPTSDRCIAVTVCSGGQNLSTTADTKLTLGEITDESGAFASSRFTVPYPGVIRISGGLKFDPINAANVAMKFKVFKNGVAHHTVEVPRGLATIGVEEIVLVDMCAAVVAGDYFELYAQCGTADRIHSASNNQATVVFEML